MKPLTIDELKALQVGDWVWVVDIESPKHGSGYWQVHGFAKTHIHLNQGAARWVAPKALYGKGWVAYRNKEEAKALDGYTVSELVEALNNEHNAFISECERSQGHRLKAGEFLASKNLLDKAIELLIQDVMSNTVDMEELSCSKCPKAEEVCVSGDCTQHWKYYYLKKAEHSLAELKKES